MDEILIVILFLIISVISNIKKKPKNIEEIDIDFSDIDMSIKPKRTSRSRNAPLDTSIAISDPEPFKKRTSKKREKPSEAEREEQIAKASAILNDIKMKVDTEEKATKPAVSFGRDDLLRAFVMKELMQRYDLNRIYERIPSFNKDE
ncbi:MAG: hypothetical protein PHF29_01020 [Candidatus Riflebacteria bacterium]|nr:hypothetical protein [Candidatus Riflebacteria bacterium]